MDPSLPLPRRAAVRTPSPAAPRPSTESTATTATVAAGPPGDTGGAGSLPQAPVHDLAAALRAAADVAVAVLRPTGPAPEDAVQVLDATASFARWCGHEREPGNRLPERLAGRLPVATALATGGASAVLAEPSLRAGLPVQVHLTLVAPATLLALVTPAVPAGPVAVTLDGLPGPQALVRRLTDRTAAARTAKGTVVLHVRLRRSAGGSPVPVTMLDPIVQRLQDSLRAEDMLVRWAPRTLGLLLAVPPGREEQVAESVRQRLLAGPGGELLEVRTADRAALLAGVPRA